MKKANLLVLGILTALAGACGDDDGPTDTGVGGDTGMDTGGGDTAVPDGVNMACPGFASGDNMAPGPQNQMGACCWRASNAERLGAPELRLSGINITAPTTAQIANTLLPAALNNETFNWLISVTGAEMDGEVTLRTGFGRRQDDGTFTFDDTDFTPGETMGMLASNNLTTGVFPTTVVVPVVDRENPEMVVLTLPLQSLTVEQATLSEDRNCIGNLTSTSGAPQFDTSNGRLTAYITVDDAATALVEDLITATLCNIFRGEIATTPADLDCRTVPQTDWMDQPDSLCDASGSCTRNAEGMTDVCDPAMNAADGGCNAWQLVANFSAQGVEIN